MYTYWKMTIHLLVNLYKNLNKFNTLHYITFDLRNFISYIVIIIMVDLHRFTSGLATALLLWPTLTEQFHILRNVHLNLKTECPTAKTGLLGGGAFVSLDASLFWLVALMLADNAREDYFEELENSSRGEYDQINNGEPHANASSSKETV